MPCLKWHLPWHDGRIDFASRSVESDEPAAINKPVPLKPDSQRRV